MAIEAFCTTCQRTVYIGDGDSGSCPVCSSPLVDNASNAHAETAGGTAPADQDGDAEVLVLE